MDRGDHGQATPGAIGVDGGEMGALIRATDWSKTKLGPIESWPYSLRTMLGVALGSRFPMLIWWGPELLHLYNDAYRPLLGSKHPASLAAPGAEVWAEIWDVVGLMARGVQEGGPATWTEDLQLFINSRGIAEETYFTFSYSPIPGDDGRVGGILGTVQETTAKVQGERQMRMLHDLAASTAEAKTEVDAFRLSAGVLSANSADVPFVFFYRLIEGGEEAHRVVGGGWTEEECQAVPEHVAMDASAAWPFAEAARAGRELVVVDLASRLGRIPNGRWGARPERAVVLALSLPGHPRPHGFLVAGISPHRSLDDRYERFFRAAADQVGNLLASAGAYESERKRAEALAELDRAKNTFFSNISHEFRTPLTLILAPVEDALSSPTGLLHGEALVAVHRSAVRLLRLVNGLLEFSRVEAGRAHLRFARADLSRLTLDLASSFRSLVERAGLTFSVDCPPISETVYVDAAAWEKVVLNLLSNAFKFTMTGEIAVSLRSTGDHVSLTVRDTGTGIPPCELPHIFERFHRVEGTAGRSFEGSGIGLSLARDLVTLLAGSMSVTSIEGEGSAFVVTLRTGKDHLPPDQLIDHAGPTQAEAAVPFVLEASRWIDVDGGSPDQGGEPLPQTAAGPEVAGGAVRPRILVADDNADMRAYLLRLLAPHYDVELAADGEEARVAALTMPPAMVLSDVMMPRLDGIGLVSALRAADATRHIPIVLLSARAGEEALLGGVQTGADDYMVKPFSARELLARVRNHLSLAAERNRAALAAEELARSRAVLVEKLRGKNAELDAFSYSVSHDLRAPLRAIDGFSLAILEDFGDSLAPEAAAHLKRVRDAAGRMGQLIDDLLSLSRIDRVDLNVQDTDLSAMVTRVVSEQREREPERSVAFVVEPGVRAHADVRLMRVVFENLVGNAWKFTRHLEVARIVFGSGSENGERFFFVADNGAGFDPAYTDKLFRPFQRLHTQAEFPGTGVGLATVARIIERHGGRVWAEGRVAGGAAFRWTLPEPSR